ncbi:uncharacterized protein [Penaeus vannamei]|uniref:uncharacterized protein n=1 Tax=Penaeus vannamei TaxID=6689 RepID=UPI00387FA20F
MAAEDDVLIVGMPFLFGSRFDLAPETLVVRLTFPGERASADEEASAGCAPPSGGEAVREPDEEETQEVAPVTPEEETQEVAPVTPEEETQEVAAPVTPEEEDEEETQEVAAPVTPEEEDTQEVTAPVTPEGDEEETQEVAAPLYGQNYDILH